MNVLFFEVGHHPKLIEAVPMDIDGEYETFTLVDDLLVICNTEPPCLQQYPNRAVFFESGSDRYDIIKGDFFVVKKRNGIFQSIDQEDIKKITKRRLASIDL